MAVEQLERIDVIFVMPKGDGRDYDARIALDVTNGTVEAARNDNLAPGQTFRDAGVYGPFPIPVTTPVSEADYLRSLIRVTFSPHRRERWITDVIVSARFSHGVTWVSHSGVVVFDLHTYVLELRNFRAVRMLSTATATNR